MKSTKQVSEELDVKTPTLLSWVRDGHITGTSKTGEGRQRRLFWSDLAVEQARKMRDRNGNGNGNGHGSKIAAVMGEELIAAMAKAKSMRDYRGTHDAIVASPDSGRIFQTDRTLSDIFKAIRGDFFIILR